ncbi:MAG: hypothetical protein A2600_03985 [Candidatus Lambdaproteobacteria bacterium RIFOXYD1_FULL_56_27]|uniref:chorismate mutase n=1 Tax=Candidatus Lambdaproteobacteria bacterium RIFOXYD2_FULL_56_26 TaxID=1817773 RepID=A0A1F6H3F8_9PROT|nr:MAG: hypothetical protein A2426_01785 [Candidatus Lambdaproteobacteria bacterium RIFOXYC1_FULL_56_13]OGH04918.1 MAG: hypothetical protein A2557_08050 [Candidatus Lambdaproteobacteria bacterium RIFOXYD2_FULL_56_26]OGH09382.1 MAG: hypothetical protein A2600_03985 [Candidatus Lambdaproteobacteria bacterium RIFOXYD1_FULL_56_27]
MAELRDSIDHLDHSLLLLWAERNKFARNLPPKEREVQWQAQDFVGLAAQWGLAPAFVGELGLALDQAALPTALGATSNLEDLWGSLMRLDRVLLEVLSERFKVVVRIGRIKKEQQIAPLDPSRWNSLLAERLALARDLGLKAEAVVHLFEAVHRYALQLES